MERTEIALCVGGEGDTTAVGIHILVKLIPYLKKGRDDTEYNIGKNYEKITLN